MSDSAKPDFIEINKITKKTDKETGQEIIKIEAETIRTEDIRSHRAWYKSEAEKKVIPGDVTLLYMKSKGEIKIAESKKSLNKRLKAVTVEKDA